MALLERRPIKQWRDARNEKPGMANMTVKVVRVLLAYAVESEYRRDNPATRIKLFKLGEHRAWTDEECTAFEARWPALKHTAARIFAGQVYGAALRRYCAGMTRAHRKGARIRVVQQKTGAELWIHEHRDLTAELVRDTGI